MRQVVAIVPAYNEEPTIGAVVETLKKSPLLSEVIVVDDGSSDCTAEVASAAGARVLKMPANRGKGAALFYGGSHTDAPIILMVDADLLGFTTEHIERLVLPVQSGAFQMMLGFIDRGPIINRLMRYLPHITGERAIEREILMNLPPEILQGFMVETAINTYVRRHKMKLGNFTMKDVDMRRKIEKTGLVQGIKGYIKMIWQIMVANVKVRFTKL